jgi:hypothetical protein
MEATKADHSGSSGESQRSLRTSLSVLLRRLLKVQRKILSKLRKQRERLSKRRWVASNESLGCTYGSPLSADTRLACLR